MTRKSQRAAAVPSEVQPDTKPAAIAEGRRPQLDDASSRAIAKASLATGFPPPAQLGLDEAAIEELRAELAAEASSSGSAVIPAETDTATATAQEG